MNLAAMYKKIFLLLYIAGIQQLHAQNPNVFESLNDTTMVKTEETHFDTPPTLNKK
jgi:hypothetical protein